MNFKYIEVDGNNYLAFQDENYNLFIVEATEIETQTYYSNDFEKRVLAEYYKED